MDSIVLFIGFGKRRDIRVRFQVPESGSSRSETRATPRRRRGGRCDTENGVLGSHESCQTFIEEVFPITF